MKVEINYDNLPPEWVELDQWVCYDIEGDKKIPYTPGIDKKARVNDDSTFRTYDEALADVESGARDHLGFVLMKKNCYVVIDLDHTTDPEEQGLNKLIFQSFPSYTERSVSGKGAHIIVRGELEGRGLHTSHFGIFEHARGILVTGDIIQGRNKIQRANKKFLRSLQEKVRVSSGKGYDFELEETEWDAQPWAVMSLASKIYGDKFHALVDGRWQGLGYPSQSEADHALLNMFCDISDSNPLVRFLFCESGLYREHKRRFDKVTGEYSVKGYVDYTIKQNRAKQDQRDYVKVKVQEDVKRQAEATRQAKKASKKKVSSNASKFSIKGFPYPTDLIDRVPSKTLRMLARHLYRNTYLPNQEVAILGALVVMTMEVQRAYFTPSGTGCNLSWWLVVDTGTGKDAFIKAVDKVLSELRQEHPKASEIHVGKFASGEAIETVISQQPRFMSRVAEAGAYWRKLLAQHRPPHIDVLVESILNLFMATEPDSFWKSRKKAKKDEDIVDTIFRPAGSFYGESTPDDLLDDLDLTAVATGLLQRQLFYHIEETEFVEANESRAPMSKALKARLSELITTADNLDLINETINVGVTKKSSSTLAEYSTQHRKYAHNHKGSLRAKMMNRSGIKAYRLASLLAIGDDPHEPVVNEKQASFAIDFVTRCDEFILNKFQSGDIGRGQLKQESDMMNIVKKITSEDEEKRKRTYHMNEFCAADVSIIPYSFLKNHAKKRISFANDKFGAITAIDRCIDSLCRAGTLVRLTRDECEAEYATTAGLLRYTAL